MTRSKIRIGTASWNDRTDLYPDWCSSSADRLRYYSNQFPIVEADRSYYSIPSQPSTAAWVRRTPEDFTFNVKAYKFFTCHQTEVGSLPRDIQTTLPTHLKARGGFSYGDLPSKLKERLWEEFEKALEPLHRAGKLGLVIFQFPQGFKPRADALNHLQECKGRLPGYRIGVELRNRRWFDGGNWAGTLEFLTRNGLIYVAVDGPQGLDSSVPPIVDAGAGICVVRFQGRNREGWESNIKAVRCDYWYSEEEFVGWIEKLRSVEAQVDEVHLIMNTNQGVENGELMGQLLGEGLKQPASLFSWAELNK